jgi:hypothetical protein
VNPKGSKNNIRFYADQTAAQEPLSDASKCFDRSNLLEAVKDLDQR